jgi:SNF2 family DNA or RNA helicase
MPAKYHECISLKSHQVKAYKFFLKNRYSIFAMDMGTGKTYAALASWNRSKAENLLVVCPGYLCRNWQLEIDKFFGGEVDSFIIKSSAHYAKYDGSPIILVSYDLAQKFEGLFARADMVVADECHMLKTLGAKRTEAFHKYIYENSTKRLLLLSGTPIKNRVSEYYSLMCLMNYERKPKTKLLDRYPDQVTFSDKFSNRIEFKVPVYKYGNRIMVTTVKWTGVKNLDLLKKYLKPFYFRVRIKDVLDLPEVVTKEVLISDTKDLDLLENFESYFSDADRSSVKSEFKRRAAITKVPFTTKYVQGLLEEVSQVVIYSDHVEPVVELARAFNVEPITGAMPGAKRAALAEKFQKKEINVLVATIESFSTGVNLTSASNVVFNDFPWVPGSLSQAIARVHRMGQSNRCVAHYVLGSPQDRYILETIKEKMEVIGKVV